MRIVWAGGESSDTPSSDAIESHIASPPSALRKEASNPGSLERGTCSPSQLSNSSFVLLSEMEAWGAY